MSDEAKKTKVLLYGLGAIGGFYAFILSRVPTIELSVVARSNYEAVKQNGLKIESKNHGSHRVDLRVLKTADEDAVIYDYILCAHKSLPSTQVPSSFTSITNLNTTIVLLQNGIGNEEPFRAAFPSTTLLACVLWVGASQPHPGEIQHTTSELTEVGVYPNANLAPEIETQRLQTFKQMLLAGGTKCEVFDDIQPRRWEKLIWNAAWNPFTMLTGVDTQVWLRSSDVAEGVSGELMREMVAVAKARGVKVTEDLVDVLMERTKGMPGFGSSMLADRKAGRRLEVEVILGTPLGWAKEMDLHTPMLELVYALVVAVDADIARKLEGENQ